jgi:type I restriction enzyme S subunit
MPNISKSKLLGLKIEVPLISEQLTFASRVQAVERAKSIHGVALNEAESLFASLQHRAFRGEL